MIQSETLKDIQELKGTRTMHPKYDEDFYGWAMANASLLKQGKYQEVDMVKSAPKNVKP